MDTERLAKIKGAHLRSQSWDDPDVQPYMTGLAETDIDDLIEALEAAWKENERLRAALRAVMDEITSTHNQEAYKMFLIAEAALAGGPQ